MLGSLHNFHIPQQYIRPLKSSSTILIFVQICGGTSLDSAQKFLQVYVFDWCSMEAKTSRIVYVFINRPYLIGVSEVNPSVPILTHKGGAVPSQEFYSKVYVKVCTTKNLISEHKLAS